MVYKSTEKATQSAVLEYLNYRGHWVWRNNTGGFTKGTSFVRFGKVGSSDILGVSKNGKFIAIECKDIKGKTTELQDFFLQMVKERGGYAVIARSLDDVINAGL